VLEAPDDRHPDEVVPSEGVADARDDDTTGVR
jgi:hypothetical protein